MISPVIDTRREKLELAKIPLFNRRFREVYGRRVVVAIVLTALCVLAAGIAWLSPWNSGYTEKERKDIWFGVAVMPFAAIIAASFLVEFAVKSVHVAVWAFGDRLEMGRDTKILGYTTALLFVVGTLCSLRGGDFDAWGYLALLLGVFVSYCFVVLAWQSTDRRRRPDHHPTQSIPSHQAGQNSAGIEPRSQAVPTPPVARPEVSLREVRVTDLPILFEHQLDPEATRMAAFPSRDRDAFMAHWAKIMTNPRCAARTILFEDRVAGNIGAWSDGVERLVGYWIGREFWGRGIATAALTQFLPYETTRPLTAHVVKHNIASIRVLQKAGFTLAGDQGVDLPGGVREEEFIYKL